MEIPISDGHQTGLREYKLEVRRDGSDHSKIVLNSLAVAKCRVTSIKGASET